MERKPRYDAQRKFSVEQKRRQAELQMYTCPDCGQSFWRKPLSTVQAHHIIPFSFGGATESSNLVLLCPDCHLRADQEAIQHGRIFGGNYTLKDAEPEQKRRR